MASFEEEQKITPFVRPRVFCEGVKIVARRASRVTDALARTSVCFERTLFVFVCGIPRVVSARGKRRTRDRPDGFSGPNYSACAYDF